MTRIEKYINKSSVLVKKGFGLQKKDRILVNLQTSHFKSQKVFKIINFVKLQGVSKSCKPIIFAQYCATYHAPRISRQLVLHHTPFSQPKSSARSAE